MTSALIISVTFVSCIFAFFAILLKRKVISLSKCVILSPNKMNNRCSTTVLPLYCSKFHHKMNMNETAIQRSWKVVYISEAFLYNCNFSSALNNYWTSHLIMVQKKKLYMIKYFFLWNIGKTGIGLSRHPFHHMKTFVSVFSQWV